MKIVIAGAGAVGFHIAELLANEEQDIILMDIDKDTLENAGRRLDVITIKGDVTSIQNLEDADVSKCDLFLAVTESETVNLLSSILAKQIGAKKTIARVHNSEYLKEVQKQKFKELGIDKLFSPTLLAGKEIGRLLKRSSFTDIFEFEGGKISVVGLTIDNNSSWIGKTVESISEMNPEVEYRGIAVLRNYQTLIPQKDTFLRRGDHLYLAVRNEHVDEVNFHAGNHLQEVKSVMIIGGTEAALQTAMHLEEKYRITLIAQEKEICDKFVEKLQNTLVVCSNYSDLTNLKEEGLLQMDAFISLTDNSEINIMTGLMAEESGVYRTIALVDNVDYTHISQSIGVDTIINTKLIAANDIFRNVRKGKVEAIASLHGVEAEVIEYEIHKKNRLTKHTIRDLHLPKEVIIAGVVRGEESFLPEGDFRFELKDKVIVFTLPDGIGRVEELFK